MTQAETKILQLVRRCNTAVPKGLAGLGTNPTEGNWASKETRFIRRLAEAGKIVWVDYTFEFGSGWAVPDLAHNFNPLLWKPEAK